LIFIKSEEKKGASFFFFNYV